MAFKEKSKRLPLTQCSNHSLPSQWETVQILKGPKTHKGTYTA